MDEIEQKKYQRKMVQKHREWFETYGPTVDALGWGSEDGMKARFQAASEVMMTHDAYPLYKKSVLDVGCGFGGLAKFVEAAGAGSYLGIDVLPEFVAEAQKRDMRYEKLPITMQATFRVQDVFQTTQMFDVVCALGVAWLEGGEEFLKELMKHCLKISWEAVVVSVSHDKTLGSTMGWNLVSAGEFAAMCDDVCERFVIRRDYWGTDMMAYLYKTPFRRW